MERVKAEMKSDILVQPYFYIEPLSKIEYWLGVCNGWFHLYGLDQAARSSMQELENKNYFPQRDSNSQPFDS